MKEVRRKQIASYVSLHHNVTMSELTEKFDVSINTIRSDVAYLVQTGAVLKVYGGVQSSDETQVPLFSSRIMQNVTVKKEIARRAAALVADGDVIYVDAGTTTMYIPDYIERHKNVTLVTPNLYIITNVASRPNINLVVLPGVLDRRTNSLQGANTFLDLSKYQIHKAFMACSGVAPDGRIVVSTYLECEIKKTAVRQSAHRYLLADASKFLESRLLSYGTVEQMDQIFSNRGLPEESVRMCQEHKVVLTLV